MTERNLLKLAKDMPNVVQENLDNGFWASYRSEAYPGKLLREYPNGRLESVTVELETGEITVLEVLRHGKEKIISVTEKEIK